MTLAKPSSAKNRWNFSVSGRGCSVPSRRRFVRCATLTVSLLLVLAFAQRSAANVIHVTTLADKVSSTGGCSLKEAIYSSTLHDTLDGVHGVAIDYTIPDHFITTGCEIGSGNDTIILPTGAVPPTFELLTDTSWDAHNPYGPTATPVINSNITIQGYGATLQWAGTGKVRLFAVGVATITTPNGVSSGTGSLTLLNVHVTGFQAKGGNGADGGGGGLGAGGAIYVQNGNLTIQNSTFDGNAATGGTGGSGSVFVGPEGGGGGGGIGGNGGHSPDDVAGGGGGGSRGNGGDAPGGGGGGGGTVNNGATSALSSIPGGPGGYLCGGDGGNQQGRDGDSGTCPGGGGGGAGYDESGLDFVENSHGGNGAYGGGGGGGTAQGGNGGFGGGGGATSNDFAQGGNGGFGGGGGLGQCCAILTLFGNPGQGGAFGGNGDALGGGGGGAALGGAIFSDSATVDIENSTFANNSLFDGQGGYNDGTKANNGGAAGAIFARDGSLTIIDSTISGNQADGSGGGVVVYSDGSATFKLEDTIIANNGTDECYVTGSVNATGIGNLIMSNGAGGSFNACPGVVVTADPQLGLLQLNPPGITPTMAISTSSSAFDIADPTTSLSTDQRGVDRPQDGAFDAGAYEACAPPIFSNPNEITCVVLTKAPPPVTVPLTIQVSPAGSGTTSPAAGTTAQVEGSVVIATATPNPGYYFSDWSDSLGNILTTESSLGVVMNESVTVQAVFLSCGCAADVTNSVSVTRGPIVLNPVVKRYVQTVTVKNSSTNTLTSPISLVLQNLSEGAILVGATSATAYVTPLGSPYVSAGVSLAPGQSISFTLQFEDPTNAAITYSTRVAAGPGAL